MCGRFALRNPEPVKAFLLKNSFNIKYKSSIGSLILAKTIILFALITFCSIGIFSIFYTEKFGAKLVKGYYRR